MQTLVEVMDLKQHGLSTTVTQGNRELFVRYVSALREMCAYGLAGCAVYGCTVIIFAQN